MDRFRLTPVYVEFSGGRILGVGRVVILRQSSPSDEHSGRNAIGNPWLAAPDGNKTLIMP